MVFNISTVRVADFADSLRLTVEPSTDEVTITISSIWCDEPSYEGVVIEQNDVVQTPLGRVIRSQEIQKNKLTGLKFWTLYTFKLLIWCPAMNYKQFTWLDAYTGGKGELILQYVHADMCYSDITNKVTKSMTKGEFSILFIIPSALLLKKSTPSRMWKCILMQPNWLSSQSPFLKWIPNST